MEKPLKKPMSEESEAASAKTSCKEKNAWAIPLGSAAYHASADTSLFSSSLPVLPHAKLNFNESENYGQSVDDNSPSLSKHQLEDKIKDQLDEVEQSPVRFLLPGDEDELLAGLMDDFDLSGLPTQVEDLDDDFFGSGGLEMEPEDQNNLLNGFANLSMSYSYPNGAATVVGEHPYGEHPSRTLFVRNINSNVEDSELKSLFEQFGDIRTLYTACKHRGFVMISYYDIRAARTAMRALQNKPLRRRKLDIHFSIPKENPSEKDVNQGTLVVFNLDPSVSNEDLRQIFGAYGEVKEIRETPHKRHHKFIEFYDVRAADAALKALNRSDIAGKRIKLEPSRPGGARRNLMQQLSQELESDEIRTFRHSVGSPVASSPPGSWSNFGSPVEPNPLRGYSQSPGLRNLSPVNGNLMPGLASILPGHLSSPKIAPIGKDTGRIGHLNQVTTSPKLAQGVGNYQHSFSVPERNPASGIGSMPFGNNSKPSGTATLSGPQFLWGSPPIHSERTDSSIWPTSSMTHPPFASNGQGQGYLHSRRQGSFLGSHHVGSAPSGIPLERHFGFPESPQTSYVNPLVFGSGGSTHNNGSQVMNIGSLGAMNMGVGLAGNFTDSGSPSSRMMPMTRNGPIFSGNSSYGGLGTVNGEGLIERGRSRKTESGNQIDNKKQYQLDLEKIRRGEDTRTTLMIKNIPNKYTSKMLLAAIDETHKNTYDFLYLPIDFKNKCNVGYAFINMVSPAHIVSFYEVFNGKKWEKFNSEKVATLAYARIQGKVALVTHFQNSSLMNEDKRCRPILFQSEGQDAADQETLPSSNLNICIRRPDGSYSGDSLDSPKGSLDGKPEIFTGSS
ncbi:protein MEI2-like 2 [Nicotiana tabacum]|uniref:Protein MEI2-like 2 n=2 Tax=Nicotiana TaxID=4085 RepID=A0A1S3Z4F4_TOBAC|nr:PREDICTED: protein MEI2-like 2 isoform X2 [Nicotiana sylvestris]XP_016459281.1 PREDICTED: protein MEI2-like 2 [Nicotiana tabacum]XP_016459282.1 PREDICTED: protein MEI2-like 2 [Nicotiana tabacum]